MKMSLPKLALMRPITVGMILLTVVGMGVIARYRTPVEFLPPADLPFVMVQIPYVGASPEQVEREIAVPAEGEFRTLQNLNRISTTSTMSGCQVQLQFDLNENMTVATAEVRDRIERLKLDLPSEIEHISIRRIAAGSLPIMAFALYHGEDDEELAHRVRTILVPRLLRLEGVADVTVFGHPEREALIEFDQDALRNRSLSLFQIVGALRQSSINISVGDIVDGASKYFVRAVGEFKAPEDLGELVIGPNSVRLRDVAKVGYRTREPDSGFSIDGQSGTFLLVMKEAEANTINTCQAVEGEIKNLKTDPLFAGVNFFSFFDQSELILSALHGLVDAGISGAGLAVIVLFLFMWRVTPTIIVALSIPTSLVFALVYIYFAGMTLNLVTMMSLIVAIGMLVDDAIVVIENIYRYRQLGYDPVQSAELGASEVEMAVTSSTLTTVVVFIPVMYLQAGDMATYLKQFAWPISVALLASLVISLTMIPLAVSFMRIRKSRELAVQPELPTETHTPDNPEGRVGAYHYAFLPKYHPLRYIMVWYDYTLLWTQRWRLATVTVVFVICVISIFPFFRIARLGKPSVDPRRIEVGVQLDQGYDLNGSQKLFDNFYHLLEPMRVELGVKKVFSRYNVAGGEVSIYLQTTDDLEKGKTLPYTTEQVLDILKHRLPDRIPGGQLKMSVADSDETATRTFSIQVRGAEMDTLGQYAERLAALMRTNIPELADVSPDTTSRQREVQINVDNTLADSFGLTPLTIAQTIDFALRGVRISDLKQGGREIPVWAQFREEDRKSRGNLENVTLFSEKGEAVPINRVVDFKKQFSPVAITRVNGKNVVTITAKLSGNDMGKVMTKLKTILTRFELPSGYSVEFGDELMGLEGNMSNFFTMLVMAALLVYIVMATSFESYVLPLSILTTIPLAAIGSIWVLYLTNTPIDIVGMIGMILLVGVVVDNGIILVDYINLLRQRGVPRHEAIIRAGHDRFRPVMMTALTSILGCVPLSMGGGDSTTGLSFASLGRAYIGGHTTATFLTLFIVPLAYSLIEDARDWISAFFGNLRGVTRPATVGVEIAMESPIPGK